MTIIFFAIIIVFGLFIYTESCKLNQITHINQEIDEWKRIYDGDKLEEDLEYLLYLKRVKENINGYDSLQAVKEKQSKV